MVSLHVYRRTREERWRYGAEQQVLPHTQAGLGRRDCALGSNVLGLQSPRRARAKSGVNERTFLAVKPDGVQRRLVGEIVRRFERKGFKLVALKLVQASEELLREHYVELREKPFYSRLVKYMSSGPVVAMVWQGLDVVHASRALIGATDPGDAMPGTIRGDFCMEVGKNVIHGSDSVESAHREIALWFREAELLCWEDSAGHWLYE